MSAEEHSRQPNQVKNGRPKRLSILLSISLLALALVPVARWVLFEIDHQFANLASGGLLLIAALFGFAGLWVLFARTRLQHLAFAILPFALAGGALTLFEYVGVTGETVPVFRVRSWLGKSRSKETLQTAIKLVPAAMQFQSSQFLGNARDGVVQNDEFSVAWKERLPSVIWRKPIGAGWASFAVGDGLAVTLEQMDEQECITAFGLTSGDVHWRISLPGKHFQAFGGVGPRATPTIHQAKVFAQTATGIVLCAELDTGKVVWQKDLLQLAGIDQATSEKGISWGRSGSPLIVDNQVVVPFGGKLDDPNIKSLIAFDLETGNVLWTGGESQLAYASPMLLTLSGVRQIVSVNEGCATGHNPANGDILWTTPWPSKSNGDACASQPVAIDDRRVLLGKGYALGSKLFETVFTGETPDNAYDKAFWQTKTVWSNTRILKTKFTSAISYKGSLYALSDGVLECVNPSDGSRIWRGKRYGQGQAIIVNDHVLVSAEDGRIALVSIQDGTPIAEMQVLDGITWNVPAVAGPYLLTRNSEEVVCLLSERDAEKNDESVSP
jgi:outer membrane protein assembly factor BamB